MFYSSPIGAIHLFSAILALALGTLVLIYPKGTRFHRQIGYGYFISMLVLNLTAFGIYRLFGGFGLFHVAAIVSLTSTVLGMIPALRRKPAQTWILHHFAWMYWSVMGLYAAFASEVLTRVPETPFFGMVGIATGIIMVIAGIVWGRKKKQWASQFGVSA